MTLPRHDIHCVLCDATSPGRLPFGLAEGWGSCETCTGHCTACAPTIVRSCAGHQCAWPTAGMPKPMGESPNTAPASSASVQTAIVRACEVCGGDIQGGRKETCSDKCRAERWRRQQEQHREDRDARIAALLRDAVREPTMGKGGCLLIVPIKTEVEQH